MCGVGGGEVLVEGYQGAVCLCMWRRVVCVGGGGEGKC